MSECKIQLLSADRNLKPFTIFLMGTATCLMLLLNSCRGGPEPDTRPISGGSIEGVVEGADGRPVPGMRMVIISGTAPFPELAPETNENGGYQFPGLSPGTFEIAVHDRQGNRLVLKKAEVRSGEASRLDFVLPALP
jgi:hypothetical protein